MKKQLLALPWQLDFLAYENDEIPVIGGVRSGKSWICGAKFVKRIQRYPRATGNYIVVPTLKAAREGTLKTFKATLLDLSLEFKQNKTDLSLSVRLGPKLWNRIIIWPESEYERLKSQEIDTVWCDEAQVWESGQAAYDFILTRLSPTPEAVRFHPDLKPQLILSANPPHTTLHWLYKYFVENAQPGMRVFRVGSYDNYLLPNRDQYLNRLKERLDEDLFRIEVLGEWGDLGVGRVYRAFVQEKHVSKQVEFDRNLPLVWTHDFGVDPRVALICQVKTGQPPYQTLTVHVIDEIRIRSGSTYEMIEEFVRRYPPSVVSSLAIFGDPAGQARNSTTGISDWSMIQTDSRLKAYKNAKIFKRSVAPLIVDRVNAVNAKLCNAKGEIGTLIHPQARYFIEDLQQTRWKEGTRQLDHGTPSKGILLTHLSDAFGYFVEREWPLLGVAGIRKLSTGTTVR